MFVDGVSARPDRLPNGQVQYALSDKSGNSGYGVARENLRC